MSRLLLPPKARLEELGREAGLEDLRGTRVILGSSVTTPDPGGVHKARHNAALDTALSSALADREHLFAVGHESDQFVFTSLADTGARVLRLRKEEGGLALPYYIISELIDMFAGNRTVMVKVEGEKDLAADPTAIESLVAATTRYDVVTGVRGLNTYNSMPYYLRQTEAMLALAIREIAGVPYDTISGVMAFTAVGREVLRNTNEVDWSYLISAPYWARKWGVRFGEADIDFRYHHEVVAEENGNPTMDAKRRTQLTTMLNKAVELAGGLAALGRKQLQAYQSAMALLSALEEIAAAY